MGKRKILLRVRNEVGCPLFRAGEHMVLDGPAVDRVSSTNICALAVAKYVSERMLALGETCEAPLNTPLVREFVCPRPDNPVIFDIAEQQEARDVGPIPYNPSSETKQALSTLRSVSVFRALPGRVLAQLAAEVTTEVHESGTVVVERGTPGRAFYVVQSGTLEVVGYADQDESAVVTRLKPRDSFGEMSLLTGAPTTASVVASSRVTLLVIPKAIFESLLANHAYLSTAFTRLLASRLMATNLLLVKEGAKPFSGKLQEMSLPTVLQALEESSGSGTLVVEDHQGRKANIGINAGRVFTAEVDALVGEPAVFEVFRWTKGDFWLDKKRIPAEDHVDCSVIGLILEGMRRIDEGISPTTPREPRTTDLPETGSS